MRVLVLSASYLPVLGGLQTVTHVLTRRLQGRGHQVQVVANRYPRDLAAQETVDGVPVRRWLFLAPEVGQLRRRRPDLFLASSYYYPSVLWRLARLVREFRPEVVNLHYPDGQIPFALRLRRHFAFRLVVSLHGHDIEACFPDGKDPRPGTTALRSLLRQSDAVTACSRYLLARAVDLEPSVATKGHVVHNGIDPDRFEDKAAYPHPRPYIFAFGRLSYVKGFDLLLEAFGQIAACHPALDLILAGEGEAREELMELEGRLGLNGRVRFYGRATPQEVVRLLNGCVLAAVPSRREPFGIGALEALAANKPLLATRVGGLPEISSAMERLAGRPKALLVEPHADALALGIRQLLRLTADSPREEVSGSCAAELFSWERAVDGYEQVLSGRSLS